MPKLKIGSLPDDKPVKLTVELPAEVDRNLRAYAEVMARETGCSVTDASKLIPVMLKRFMATDRVFKRLKRELPQNNRG